MQRYFISEDCFNGDLVIIKGNDFHHIKNVMRLKIGDNIIINDYSGNSFLSVIKTLEKHQLTAQIINKQPVFDILMNITLAQSLIRKDHFEMVLQKATELGIKKIIPLQTKRSIIKIHDMSKKYERYHSIVKEASEQSERRFIPEISGVLHLNELPYDEFDVVLVAYAREDISNKLSKAINQIDCESSVLILIGPEGGFSDEEIKYLESKAMFVSLGNTILRSETAALYIISAFRYAWEN